MAVTIKAKEGFDHDNPYQVGQSGLIGNPGAPSAFNGFDLVLMLGTDFPRTHVDLGLVGDAGVTAGLLADRVKSKRTSVRTSGGPPPRIQPQDLRAVA